jgi:hypothetical protein
MFVSSDSYLAGNVLPRLVRRHRIEALRNGYSRTCRKKRERP